MEVRDCEVQEVRDQSEAKVCRRVVALESKVRADARESSLRILKNVRGLKGFEDLRFFYD